MTETIFRQSALDRMASPERLDAPLRLVGRPSWLLLGAIAFAIVAGLVWAIATSAPVKVSARGLLIDRTGLAEITAADAGRIERLMVAPGDTVKVGQPIATLARTDLVREIAAARANLADAEARYARLQSFYAAQGSRQAGADSVRLSTIAESRQALTERERYLVAKAAKMEALIVRGFIKRDDLVNLQIDLAEVRERLANLGETALRVRIDANQRSGETGLALLDEQRTIDEQQRTIARLSAQLADQQSVRATQAGVITEVKVNAGDVIAAGSALVTLSPTDGSLVALLYIPAADGKRIMPGMDAEIAPTTVERAVFGHIPGKVIAVAPLPSTAEGLRRVLRNDQLVQELLAGGAPIEVRVALDRDRANASGFVWSASKGPRTQVSAGSPVEGRVVVERTRMIRWLIPGSGE